MQIKYKHNELKIQRKTKTFTFPGMGVVETSVGVGMPKRLRCALSSKPMPFRLFSPTFRAHWKVVFRSCRSDSGPSTKKASTYRIHGVQLTLNRSRAI